MATGNVRKAQNATKNLGNIASTWSGIPLKPFFSPGDIRTADYADKLGDPGKYPFTRGIYPDGYRGKDWTRRQQTGYGSPADTNERIKFYLRQGFTGANAVLDTPTSIGIDPDHPRAEGEVGLQGVSLCSIKDIEALADGIPLGSVSWTWESPAFASPTMTALVYLLAERRGENIATMRGTIINEPLLSYNCGFLPEGSMVVPLALKLSTDVVEYCIRHMPKMHSMYVDSYNLREEGVDAVQEAAWCLAKGICYVQRAIKRGMKVDEFGPRISFFCSANIDFFEEICKIRAMRRIWARIMKEQFRATDPRSMHFRFAVETAGSSLTSRQPLNNIVRITSEAMAAALANTQAMTPACYDEAISIPSESSATMSVRIQQILTCETGITSVADPLGGSYYVESLTNTLEEKILALLHDIEEKGGIVEAIRSNWFDEERIKASLRWQGEIQSGERTVVGLNAFTSEQEAEQNADEIEVFRPDPKSIARHVASVKRLKATRNTIDVENGLRSLHLEARKGEKANLIPSIIEAVKLDATLGEVNGMVRLAWDLPYDPFGILEPPFPLS